MSACVLLGRTTAHGKTWRVWFKGYMACAFVRTLGTLCQFFSGFMAH